MQKCEDKLISPQVYLEILNPSHSNKSLSGVCVLSHVQVFVTPWTVTHQAPLSMEFSTQKYWCGLPFPTPRNIHDPGIEHRLPALQVDSLPLSDRESRISLIVNSKADSVCEEKRRFKEKNKTIPKLEYAHIFEAQMKHYEN